MTWVLLQKYAEEAGWDTSSMVDVLCEYIDNQDDFDTFEAFLKQQVEGEAAMGSPEVDH